MRTLGEQDKVPHHAERYCGCRWADHVDKCGEHLEAAAVIGKIIDEMINMGLQHRQKKLSLEGEGVRGRDSGYDRPVHDRHVVGVGFVGQQER